VIPFPMDELVENLSDIHMARYSDGELFCMAGHRGLSGSGIQWTRERAGALLKTLDGGFRHVLAEPARQSRFQGWLDDHRVEWYDDPIGPEHVQSGSIRPLIEALRRHRILLVGPWHLQRLQTFPFTHIVIPPMDAADCADIIETRVRRALPGHDVVVLCAGFAANLLVHRLDDCDVGLVDCGAIFDHHVGVLSRRWIRQWSREEIIALCERSTGMDVTGSWLSRDDEPERSWGPPTKLLYRED
jgi:hypothetical protein